MNSLSQLNSPRARFVAGSLVIVAAAALAVSPQLIWGDSCGHDFDFHLVSWFDALNSWRHGIPYPHWTPSANFGAGEPRFVFYSPLTWMLGAALATVIPWPLVPVALTFVLLAGTGLATRALAREVLGEGASTLAGCIAIISGYPLFTAYERSAFAELAGGIWIPLVLMYALRTCNDPNTGPRISRRLSHGPVVNGSVVPLALAIAGAWLSNPTVGVMGCYLLAALALVVAWLLRSWWPVVRAAAGATLGMGVSAIYLLPAAWEQHWVDIHQVTEDPGQTLENNWLFARHADPALAFHDQVLHTASTIAVLMIAVTIAAIVVCKLLGRLPAERSWWLPLAIIPAAVLLLQFSLSDRLWNLLPELRFLQFPWRWLLTVEAPMAIFLAAALWPRTNRIRARVTATIVYSAIFTGITFAADKDLYQTCYAEDSVPSMIETLQAGKGYIGTYEYEPKGADIGRIPKNLPQACLTNGPNLELGKADADGNLVWDASQGSCDATFARFTAMPNISPDRIQIVGSAPHSGYLVVRLLSYPAWQMNLNRNPVAHVFVRKDGLMAVSIPQGAFVLTARWTATSDVVLARWISGLSVFALTCMSLYARSRRRRVKLWQARVSFEK